MTKWDTIQTDILPVIPRSWEFEDTLEDEDLEDEDLLDDGAIDRLLAQLEREI